MNSKVSKLLTNATIKGTLILTFTGFLNKFIGFYYKIFLARVIGAEGIGIYQLVFPVMGIAMALCSSGFETAISKFCAKGKKMQGYFTAGITVSVLLSVSATLIVYQYADFIAQRFLLNPDAAPLLSVLSLSFPFACIHQCICGYYYGQRKTMIPAFSQLIEQLARVLAVIIICILLHNTITVTAVIAVYGIVLGEIASCIFCMLSMLLKSRPFICYTNFNKNLRDLLSMAFPLSCNRLLLMLLTSGEAILIPAQLIHYGMTSEAALSAYGVLTGMALSFITFPCALTHSAAVMLLPTVSKAQAMSDAKSIDKTIKAALQSSIALGVASTVVFITVGAPFGAWIFHEAMVSHFIRALAWLCPFLYMNNMLSGIINGLGKTNITFLANIGGICIRLFFIIAVMPLLGIEGYMTGFLISQMGISTVYILFLLRGKYFN